jgi:hypothetical protein
MITTNSCLVTVRAANHEGTGNGWKGASRRYLLVVVVETKSAICVCPKLIPRLSRFLCVLLRAQKSVRGILFEEGG